MWTKACYETSYSTKVSFFFIFFQQVIFSLLEQKTKNFEQSAVLPLFNLQLLEKNRKTPHSSLSSNFQYSFACLFYYWHSLSVRRFYLKDNLMKEVFSSIIISDCQTYDQKDQQKLSLVGYKKLRKIHKTNFTWGLFPINFRKVLFS